MEVVKVSCTAHTPHTTHGTHATHATRTHCTRTHAHDTRRNGNADRLQFAQYLIGKGANPLARGTQGTAADVANQVHETAIAAYLQGAYAQP